MTFNDIQPATNGAHHILAGAILSPALPPVPAPGPVGHPVPVASDTADAGRIRLGAVFRLLAPR